MEEYLQCMKTLRSQINDVEDQAAKTSVEEQMNITTIQTLQKDLDLAKIETKRLKEETDEMTKAKGQLCSHILVKQRKIASLESDSLTLSQSLELIQQERGSLSAKLVEKSMYYIKVAEDIIAQLKEQQAWINSHQHFSLDGNHSLAGLGNNDKPCGTEDSHRDKEKSLMENLSAVKVNFQQMTQQKSRLASEYIKVKESVELVSCKINAFKCELKEMDEKSLEEELEALLSDKAGETDYMQSLRLQISKLKEIPNFFKCSCGEMFKIELDGKMMSVL